jgi:MerR family copper efflux transcriptional regulator
VFLPEGRRIAPCVYNLVVGLHQQKYTYRAALRFTGRRARTRGFLRDLPSLSSKNTLTLECVEGLILRMVQSSGSKTLRSGALAKSAGVSPDTIRHYEKIGILPRASRTPAGYRVYPASAVERVLVVQRALRIGFTLAELAEVLKARDAGGVPCRRVYQLAEDKLRGIEVDIEALKRTRRYVKKVLCDWEQRIQSAGSGEKSHLLYSLTDAVRKAGTPANQFRRKKLT